MSTLQFSDDASLQRWGRNFSGAEEAASEVAALYAKAAEAAAEFNSIFGKIHTQGESDLPASNQIKADVEALYRLAQRAVTPEDWRAVAAECAALPATYNREHETDNERFDGGRGGRMREKRADVGYAEHDM